MSAQRLKKEGPIARSVREALSLIFADPKAQMVLDQALMIAQRGVVPEEADRARSFVYGPLLTALERHADETDTEVVLERLEPILTMAGSHVRVREDESGVQPQDELPPAIRPATERVILVSSLDRTSIQSLARQLHPRAKVRQVGNVFDLISAVEKFYDDDPTIIIDCSLPAVDPMTLATMLPIHLDEVTVILWGATQAQRVALEKEMPVARHWIPCPSTANHADLAMVVEHLLDRADALRG
jgi:hypothetical protein